MHDRAADIVEGGPCPARRPHDAHQIGAEIGENYGAQWHGAETVELDDAETCQGPHAAA